MALFRGENPNLGTSTTVSEVGASSTSTTTLVSSDFKPMTREMIDYTMATATQHATGWLYLAPWKCKVVAVRENHTAASATGTLDVVKIVSDAVAPAAANGTTILTMLTTPMSTAGTANTRQNLALTTTVTSLTLNAGDQLAIVTGGSNVGYTGGNVQVEVTQIG